jgi:hypothetical protein
LPDLGETSGSAASVDIVIDQDEAGAEGFRVARGVFRFQREGCSAGTPCVELSHYWSVRRHGESRTLLQPMTPDTARRVAAELAAMADIVEAES